MTVACLKNPNVELDAEREAQCNERFAANIALLQSIAPQLAKMLTSMTELHSDLVPVGEDDWDIHFRGIPLYGRGARDYAADQIAHWVDSPTRIRVSHPSQGQFDAHSGEFYSELSAAIDQEGFRVGSEIIDPTTFHFACFGVGLGFHLPTLFERLNPRNVFLFETNPEFLYHSMRVLDWSQIFDPTKYGQARLQFVTTIDLHKAPIALREQIRAGNPCLVDGASIYQHYANDQYRSVIVDMLKGASLAMSGLGFLDDEVRMVRNSYLNLKQAGPRMFKNQSALRDWPLFLIGSGPSLDGAVEHIKRNADRAVIVACGTSLPALFRHGIRPDMFVILENGPEIYDYVRVAQETWGLEGITLLASSTIDPRVAEMFEHSVMYMRPGLASFPIFGVEPSMGLTQGHPTVTNTGFAAAVAFGYQDIYLFGIDLGSRVPERHHSSASPYMADGMEFDDPLTQAVPGNFGGQVYTSYVFNWSRDVFEQVIALCRRPLQVFNTSDGAFIPGTHPRLARTLNLPQPANSKAEELAALWGGMAPYGEERFSRAWNRERLVAASKALSDEVCAALEGITSARQAIIEIVRVMGPQTPLPAHHFIRGSLMQQMILANYYLNRAEPEDLPRLNALIVELLGKYIRRFSDHVVGFISDLDDGAIRGPWLRTPQGVPSEW